MALASSFRKGDEASSATTIPHLGGHPRRPGATSG